MGKQTFDRLKRTLAILLVVIFVLSLTVSSVTALYRDPSTGAMCEVYKKTGDYPNDVRCCTVPGTDLVECCDINYEATSPETRYINCETTDVSKTGARPGGVIGGIKTSGNVKDLSQGLSKFKLAKGINTKTTTLPSTSIA